ncbi:MAG: HAD-IIB family hydrolase [Planctomycetes bacterium]|nr:HAD-IIB family hydrolase [Planctomycetota bacterium]
MPQRPIRLFVSDLDGTLLPFDGDQPTVDRFSTWWNALPLNDRPLLVYSSGRLYHDVLEVVPQVRLPPPDFVIGGVGTSIVDGAGRPVVGYRERFREGWDRSLVHDVMVGVTGVQPQPARYQSPFKSSWFLYDADEAAVARIRVALAEVELRVRVIYSSRRDLDVLPEDADKGRAVSWVAHHLHVSPEHVVVAGDTENDLAMFQVDGVRGIVVANATPGLLAGVRGLGVFRAKKFASDGVIEGLTAFGLGTPATRAARRLIRKPL